jgi:hypothetical protein
LIDMIGRIVDRRLDSENVDRERKENKKEGCRLSYPTRKLHPKICDRKTENGSDTILEMIRVPSTRYISEKLISTADVIRADMIFPRSKKTAQKRNRLIDDQTNSNRC